MIVGVPFVVLLFFPIQCRLVTFPLLILRSNIVSFIEDFPLSSTRQLNMNPLAPIFTPAGASASRPGPSSVERHSMSSARPALPAPRPPLLSAHRPRLQPARAYARLLQPSLYTVTPVIGIPSFTGLVASTICSSPAKPLTLHRHRSIPAGEHQVKPRPRPPPTGVYLPRRALPPRASGSRLLPTPQPPAKCTHALLQLFPVPARQRRLPQPPPSLAQYP